MPIYVYQHKLYYFSILHKYSIFSYKHILTIKYYKPDIMKQ